MNKQDLISTINELYPDMEFDSYVLSVTDGKNTYTYSSGIEKDYFYWVGWLEDYKFNLMSKVKLQNDVDQLESNW